MNYKKLYHTTCIQRQPQQPKKNYHQDQLQKQFQYQLLQLQDLNVLGVMLKQ